MKVHNCNEYKKGILWLIECAKGINEANKFKPGYFPSISPCSAFNNLMNEYNVEEQYNENIGIAYYNITYLLREYYVPKTDKEIILPFLHKHLVTSEQYTDSADAFYSSYVEDETYRKGIMLALLLLLNDEYKSNVYLIENRVIDDMSFTEFMENNFDVSI